MIDEETPERECVLVFLQRSDPLTDHQALFGLVERLSGPEDLESEDRVQVWPKKHHVDTLGIDQSLELPNHREPLVRGRHLGKLDGDVQIAHRPRALGGNGRTEDQQEPGLPFPGPGAKRGPLWDWIFHDRKLARTSAAHNEKCVSALSPCSAKTSSGLRLLTS